MDRSEGGEGSSSVDVGTVNILNTRIELSVGAIHQSNAAGRRGKGERVERDLLPAVTLLRRQRLGHQSKVVGMKAQGVELWEGWLPDGHRGV